MSESDRKLYVITVTFAGGSQYVKLGYWDADLAVNEFERARDVLEKESVGDNVISFEDDFGSTHTVAGVVHIGLTKLIDELEFGQEMQLHQARAQQRLQKRAASDPALNQRQPNIVVPERGPFQA